MKKVPEEYAVFTEGKTRMPHWLRAFLPSWHPTVDREELLARLDAFEVLSGTETIELEAQDDEEWRVKRGGYEIALGASESLDRLHFTGSGLRDEEIEAIQASDLTISLQTTLGASILEDFHSSLKVLHALAP